MLVLLFFNGSGVGKDWEKSMTELFEDMSRKSVSLFLKGTGRSLRCFFIWVGWIRDLLRECLVVISGFLYFRPLGVNGILNSPSSSSWNPKVLGVFFNKSYPVLSLSFFFLQLWLEESLNSWGLPLSDLVLTWLLRSISIKVVRLTILD